MMHMCIGDLSFQNSLDGILFMYFKFGFVPPFCLIYPTLQLIGRNFL